MTSKNHNLFVVNKPQNFTKMRSPVAAASVERIIPQVSQVSLKPLQKKPLLLPELALSPMQSSRTVFGTHRRSETVASRNLLDKIVGKTITPEKAFQSLQGSPTRSNKGFDGESTAKKPPLKALIDADEKFKLLDKPKIATSFLREMGRNKTKAIVNTVDAIYKRRIDEVHERNTEKPKLKLYSPYKRRMTKEKEVDNYDWQEMTPYDTNLALEALDDPDPLNGKTDQYKYQLEECHVVAKNSNTHIQQAIGQ